MVRGRGGCLQCVPPATRWMLATANAAALQHSQSWLPVPAPHHGLRPHPGRCSRPGADRRVPLPLTAPLGRDRARQWGLRRHLRRRNEALEIGSDAAAAVAARTSRARAEAVPRGIAMGFVAAAAASFATSLAPALAATPPGQVASALAQRLRAHRQQQQGKGGVRGCRANVVKDQIRCDRKTAGGGGCRLTAGACMHACMHVLRCERLWRAGIPRMTNAPLWTRGSTDLEMPRHLTTAANASRSLS